MAQVRIGVGNVTGSVELRAYAGTELIATSPPLANGSGVLEVAAAHITSVTIPLNFRTLTEICYCSMDEACKDKSWGEPIARLPLVASVDEAFDRLEGDLRNRYVADNGQATLRYQHELAGLIHWLHLLQDPDSLSFTKPGIPPDQLQLPAPTLNSPLATLRPQGMLLLAALDPNIARFLSLYWVDSYDRPQAPQRGASYDYKVAGTWEKHEATCGMLFGLGAEEAQLPRVGNPLTGNQLPGLRWRGREPLGRVGLSWPRQPGENQGPVSPILFDLWRDPGGAEEAFLTKESPVLVPAPIEENAGAARFIDTNVPIGNHTYRLRAIDLFGQVGEPISSESIRVRDLEAPPPPVRLRAALRQPGHPWRTPAQLEQATAPASLELQFEYGDAQHRQAPDAQAFQVYWRAESMFDSHSVEVESVASVVAVSGLNIHTVRARDAGGLDLGRFVGGRLSRESTTDEPLPVTKRRHYQVAQRLTSDRFRLVPTEQPFPNGRYRLVSDPHLRSNWTALDFTVPVRQPSEGLLLASEPLRATATRVQTRTARPDPLAQMPASHRPVPQPEPPAVVEVELDRKLLEPDLFAGGTVMVDGRSFSILYSTSGSESGARIGLDPGSRIPVGAALVLTPALPLVQTLRILGTVADEIVAAPGGEVAFDVGEDEKLVTYTARAVSSVEVGAGNFNVVVRLSPAAQAALRTNRPICRYHAPYRLDLPLRLPITVGNTDPARTLVVPLSVGQGSQSAYLAVTTRDERQKEGSLSSPAQVMAIKPPPTGKPSRPFPCDQDAAAVAGYATPPDRQGRATLCLAWGAGTLGSTTGLRYEVARALDNTILATHRRNWLLGGPARPGAARMDGQVSNVTFDAARGTWRLDLSAPQASRQAAAFRMGRLTQGGHSFQVTGVEAKGANRLELAVRAMAQAPPVDGAARLEAPPDYDATRDDIDALRRMASENPDAFGVVTGVPIVATHFRDEIPGIGRNRYFYRIRAVDAAENRSAWSEVSAPFHQVDTSPPETPALRDLQPTDRGAILTWLPPDDSLGLSPGNAGPDQIRLGYRGQVTGYRIYRTDGEPADFHPRIVDPIATIGLQDVQLRPLTTVAGSLAVPEPVVIRLGAGLSDDQVTTQVSAQIRVQARDAGPAAPNLFDPATGQVVHRKRPLPDGTIEVEVTALGGVNTSLDGTPLRLTIGSKILERASNEWQWRDSGLQGGTTYTYRMAAMKRVPSAGGDGGIEIVGDVSKPWAILPFDFSIPAAPTIPRGIWTDEGGRRAVGADNAKSIYLVVQSPLPNVRDIGVQRRLGEDGPWSTVRPESRTHQLGWLLVDREVDPRQVWQYRVHVRMMDNRVGAASDVFTVRVP